jgi:hypothetical protein
MASEGKNRQKIMEAIFYLVSEKPVAGTAKGAYCTSIPEQKMGTFSLLKRFNPESH